MKKIGLLFTGLMLFCIGPIQGQEINEVFFQPERRGLFEDISLGIGLHYNYLAGDLRSLSHEDDDLDFGFGIHLNKQISPTIELGLEYFGDKVTGSPPTGFHEDYAYKVETDFSMTTMFVKLYINRLQEHYGRHPKTNYYLRGGLSRLDYEYHLSHMTDPFPIFEEHAYGLDNSFTTWAYSIGIGVERYLSSKFYIDASVNAFISNDDFIDGDPTINIASNDGNDAIVSTKVGIAYRFGPNRDRGYKWFNSYVEDKEKMMGLEAEIADHASKLKGLSADVKELKLVRVWADADQDGVHDADDLEPDTREGAMVNFQGIEIPEGSDGIMAFNPVFFKFDISTLEEKFHEHLAAVALYMKDNMDAEIILVGHADKIGSVEYNEALSERRVEEVKRLLVEAFGINGDRFILDSKGETQQISTFDNINRRVDFVVK